VVHTQSKIVGFLIHGFFYDLEGGVVAFTDETQAGCRQAVSPAPPILPPKPMSGAIPMTPVRPKTRNEWGKRWTEFLQQ
jgi:hypothetical protein